MIKQLALKILWIYQKFFTVLGFGCCRFYPSCSEYARINFEKNSIFLAFFNSLIRILKCNQLFDGGIDYPVLKKLLVKPKRIKLDCIKYWLVSNNNNNYYYIIKNFSYKG